MSTPETPQTPDTPPSGGYTAPPPPPGGYTAPPPGGYPAPQGGYAGPPPGQPVAPVSESDERTWAMLGHLGGILIGFIAGLIVYLVYKDRSQYLKEQGAEALNFQITITIGYVVATVTSFIFIGFLLFPILWIVQIVFGIIAGLAANKHENYRYPFAIRFIK
jgi:hypothetical protein